MYENDRPEQLKLQLKLLVSHFSANIAEYKNAHYDESNTRTDFIDKLFTLLDWDVANNQAFSESYREVVREDKVTIDGAQKAPDYSFRIGGTRKFFVEAKKPSVNIKEAAECAYQIRRYGYTAKLPLSILTNFEEFAIYDTRIKPDKNDKASAARIDYFTFKEYGQKWDFLYGTFSKNAINKGSFDKYVMENKNKKGTSEVDAELLALVEEWRIVLAKNIARNNPGLSLYSLNTVVQKIIDRIVFLRIAEDKGIEDENLLLTVAKTSNIYEKLNLLFTKASVKYNSGLFTYVDWMEKVVIDDKTLSDIIVNLYYPECPYEFSVLPVEILGSIYERFLGNTIHFRAVKGDIHTAIVEEKPEVKKAGGVYYTPQHIVDYIVQNTVGEIVKNKKPEEITGIRICDPACGSGSFLVGAYQYLLDYHLDYYAREENIKPSLKDKKIFEAGYKTYKLTINEKQRILTNNIFGVDIDNQAVEVTKLSLYLKLLEDESRESSERLFKHSDLTFLPYLEDNIKCGNSLIETDFYAQQDLVLTDDDRIKINCFDWEKEFPAVFNTSGMDAAVNKNNEFAKQTQNIKTGMDVGFDVVIGNPPYYNIQTLGAGSETARYIQKKYADIWQDKSDILFYFLAKAMQLSKRSIGFILSNALLFSDKAGKLRNKIIEDGRLAKIVNFEQFQIFKGAGITTGIFIFQSEHTGVHAAALKGRTYTIKELQEYINNGENYFDVKFEKDAVFALTDSRTAELTSKIDGNHSQLQDIFLIGKGMETAANDVFLFSSYPKQFPKRFIKKRVIGENIERYFLRDNPEYLLYFEDIENFKELPVSIQNHLNNNRKTLKERATVKNEGRAWWRYSRPMHKEHYHLPKIWCSYRSKENAFIIDETDSYIGLTNTTVIFGTNDDYLLKYVLALLNSKLFAYRIKSMAKQTGGGVFEYLPNNIGKFPIPKASKETQNNISALVDKMMELKKKEASEENQQLKAMITRQIDSVDKAVDTEAYKLYNLTDDEIRVAESG